MSLNFDLPKDAELTRKIVREFAEKEIAPIAQELDDREEFSYELTRKMGELDFFGPFVTEGYGGSEVGYLNYIITVEEIARIDGSQAATIAAGNSLGIAPIYYFRTRTRSKNGCRTFVKVRFYLHSDLLSRMPGLTRGRPGLRRFLMETNGSLMGVKFLLQIQLRILAQYVLFNA